MQNSILTQLGLDANQILVYTYLLENGASKASAIAKNTPLKRGLVYKVLDELVELQIIEKNDPEGAVSIFTPLHPSALKSLAESKVRQAQNAQNHLDSDIGSLISMYNLANNKPGIEFYEGVKGIERVYNEILRDADPDTPIISIVKVLDHKLDEQTYSVINNYIKKRIKKNVFAHSIAINDKTGIELQKSDKDNFRKTKLISAKKMPVSFAGGEIIIHNKKIFFLSYENNVHMAISIMSSGMYYLLFSLFESLWASLEDNK